MIDIKLDLGCGLNCKPGFVGVDIEPKTKANIIWDLNRTPIPIDSNSVVEVYSRHMIEHLNDPFSFLEEVWRVCKHDARVTFSFPHFTKVWNNISHKSGVCSNLLDSGRDCRYDHSRIRFKTEGITYRWRFYSGVNKFKSFFHFMYFLCNVGFNFVLNLDSRLTEELFCFWVGGVDDVRVVGRVVK